MIHALEGMGQLIAVCIPLYFFFGWLDEVIGRAYWRAWNSANDWADQRIKKNADAETDRVVEKFFNEIEKDDGQ